MKKNFIKTCKDWPLSKDGQRIKKRVKKSKKMSKAEPS